MDNSAGIARDQGRYSRLDSLLLYLLTVELGFFILLILAGLVIAIINMVWDLSGFAQRYPTWWFAVPFIIGIPLNVLGGFLGIVLNIRTGHEGYPGTGHLLNWIFLMTSGWLFIVGLMMWLLGTTRLLD